MSADSAILTLNIRLYAAEGERGSAAVAWLVPIGQNEHIGVGWHGSGEAKQRRCALLHSGLVATQDGSGVVVSCDPEETLHRGWVNNVIIADPAASAGQCVELLTFVHPRRSQWPSGSPRQRSILRR